jgi:hypothetical protein
VLVIGLFVGAPLLVWGFLYPIHAMANNSYPQRHRIRKGLLAGALGLICALGLSAEGMIPLQVASGVLMLSGLIVAQEYFQPRPA